MDKSCEYLRNEPMQINQDYYLKMAINKLIRRTAPNIKKIHIPNNINISDAFPMSPVPNKVVSEDTAKE